MIDRSLLPDPRAFYERELAPARIGRPNRKGWALTRCPAHKSKSGRSFAINVETGAFHCFGCDASGGDVIDFVRLRNHCDFPQALKVLGISDEPLTAVERLQLEQRQRIRDEEIALAQQARCERLRLRDSIHALARIQHEASDALADAESDDEREQWWSVLQIAFEDLRDSENEYMRLSGLEKS